MSIAEWRKLIRNLRSQFPTECQVVVRRRPATKYSGLTMFNGYKYHITIASQQDSAGQIDTLLHEWAHVFAIDQAYEHASSWGTAFTTIYEWWERYNET